MRQEVGIFPEGDATNRSKVTILIHDLYQIQAPVVKFKISPECILPEHKLTPTKSQEQDTGTIQAESLLEAMNCSNTENTKVTSFKL
jgi:hypothetical protein